MKVGNQGDLQLDLTMRLIPKCAEESCEGWVSIEEKMKSNRGRKGVPPLFEPEPQSRWLHTCSDFARSEYAQVKDAGCSAPASPASFRSAAGVGAPLLSDADLQYHHRRHEAYEAGGSGAEPPAFLICPYSVHAQSEQVCSHRL